MQGQPQQHQQHQQQQQQQQQHCNHRQRGRGVNSDIRTTAAATQPCGCKQQRTSDSRNSNNNNNSKTKQLAKENMLHGRNAVAQAESKQQSQQRQRRVGKYRRQQERRAATICRQYGSVLAALALLSGGGGGRSSCALAYNGINGKLTNCYDVNINYSVRLNGTAPTQQLPVVQHHAGYAANAANMLRSSQRQQPSSQSALPPALLSQPLDDAAAAAVASDELYATDAAAHADASVSPPLAAHAALHDWKCCCWNATAQEEVECRCEGEGLTRVPQTLSVPVQRLTIASASLPGVRSTGLIVYAATLTDIVLTDLKELQCIQDGAFASLRLLRTIYISHAPKLLYLSKDVFQGISDTIKIIRIINSGLLSMPDLVHLPPKNILQMIDLDNNHITRIERNSIKIKTDQLILANNEINYIDDSAFNGSQIAKLSLKENRALREVHPNAFKGMSMQALDLSSTSLVRLPSAGLQDIEELRIENTQTLKTIPSIYNFQNLQRAYLTHSFHCCAFKYPSRHDPRRHAERMKELETRQQQCSKTPTPVVERRSDAVASTMRSSASPISGAPGGGWGDVVAVRQRVKETGTFVQADVGGGSWGAALDDPQLNMAMTHPTRDDGIFYSRWERASLTVSDDINETELLQRDNNSYEEEWGDDEEDNGGWGAENDGDYVDDSMAGSSIEDNGIFHDKPITLNTAESQVDEYCGNFTSRKRDIECYPMPDALNPCEDVMGYQWLRISVWIVVTLAVVGNVAVLVVILSIRTDTSVPRFLMCHLAFADLCLGLYLLLIAAIDAHSMGEYFNYAYDWQYGAGCKVAGFLTVFASHLSVFTLTIITIERWLAITQALLPNKRLKLRSATYIMAGGWLYAIFMSAMPLFGISNYSSTSICLPMEIGDLYDTVYLVSILALNGTAFCIIAICYAKIYLSLGQETRHAHTAHPGEMGIAKKMALLVFTNFACCAPIAFFGLTALAGMPLINVTKSKILLVFFYPLNSCADPYMYAILTAQYRQDLFTLLSKFGMCKKTALRYKEGASFNTPPRRDSASIVARKSLIARTPETQFMLQKNENFV